MPTSHANTVSPFQSSRKVPPLDVLILDDERYDRHRLARLCSGLGFPCVVQTATTLKEFGIHLDHENFGLILLDYALPDGNGLDALHMVQLSARNLNTPTLMISGQAEDVVAERARAAGCSGYLSKDALSSDGFSQAVKGAIEPISQIRNPSFDRFDTMHVKQLLAQTRAKSAQEIKPMVSRLMRQMRNLRASQSIEDKAAVQTIEQNCMSLWTFLVEMEREDGTALMAQITGSSDLRTTVTSIEKSTKPPSPFTSRRH